MNRSFMTGKWPLAALLVVSSSLPALAALPKLPGTDFKSNPALKERLFEEASPVRSLNIYVEVMEGAELDRPDEVAKGVADLFEELEARFDQRFPGLDGRKRIDVVVVTHPDTWHAARGERPMTEGADFLDALGEHGTVVMYDFAWPGGSRKSREEGARFALGQALVAAAADVPAVELPAALTLGVGHLMREKDGATLGGPLTERMHAELREGGFGHGFFMDLTELAAIRGFDALHAHALAATTEVNAKDHWAGQRMERLADQMAFTLGSALDDPARSEPAQAWLAAVLAGEADAAALGALDEGAWAVLLAHLRGVDPGLDPREVAGSPAFGRATAALTLPAVEANAAAGNADDAIAEGAYLASIGKLDAALRALGRAGSDARAQRFATGIDSIRGLRRGFLESLALGESDEKLRFEWDGRLLVASVTRVGNETVFLGENTREIKSLPIADLPMPAIVERMEKEDEPYGEAAARAWTLALAKGKWKNSLSSAEKKNTELVGDLESVADQLERGRTLSLISIARDANGQSADARLAAMGELCATAADSADFEAAREGLLAGAKAILDERFGSADLTDLLAASEVEVDGNRYALMYDFSDADQLADWPRVETYAPAWLELLQPLDTKQPLFEVDKKDKELALQGLAVAQHILSFKGPIRVSFDFEIPKQGKKSDANKAVMDTMYISICDDLDYQHIRSSQFGDIDIVDTESGTSIFKQNSNLPNYNMGKTYDFEMTLDADGKVTTRYDKKHGFEEQAPGRVEGRVVLMSYSDRELRVKKLRIEGDLAADQGSMKAMWVQAQLDALGF